MTSCGTKAKLLMCTVTSSGPGVGWSIPRTTPPLPPVAELPELLPLEEPPVPPELPPVVPPTPTICPPFPPVPVEPPVPPVVPVPDVPPCWAHPRSRIPKTRNKIILFMSILFRASLLNFSGDS